MAAACSAALASRGDDAGRLAAGGIITPPSPMFTARERMVA